MDKSSEFQVCIQNHSKYFATSNIKIIVFLLGFKPAEKAGDRCSTKTYSCSYIFTVR